MLIGMSDSGEVVSTAAPLGPHRSATPELHATYTTLEIIVALIAVVGNAMVIHVFCRDRRLRRRTNYYIVSLAVADLLVGLLGIPFAILASVGLPRNLHACLFTVSLLVMLCTISIFCLVGVSVDRYWAILHPMCYSRNVRTKTAIVTKVSARGGHGGGHGGSHGHSSGGHHSSGGRGRFGGFFGKSRSSHVSATHAYYSYHPPQQMRYVCSHCNGPTNYPVFHGQPPTYVYKYRESGSKFGDLLSGLALYNLGRASNDHTPYNNYYHQQNTYEECSMQVIDRTHFEETRVPCFMVSTFMERAAAEPQGPQANQMDISTAHVDVNQFLNDTGTPVEVTSNQECVIWHNTTINRERNQVPCALLKRYADTLKPSGIPVYIWFPSLLIAVMAILVMCQCYYRRKEDKKESVPLNEGTVLGYSSYCP